MRRDVPIPERFASLPLNEAGYPVPFFAAEVEGKRDIRVVSANAFHRCVRERLCWLCGQTLAGLLAFVVTDAGARLRRTREPPCHPECAEFALRICPFITNPEARYRNGTAHPGPYRIYLTSGYRVTELRNAWPAGEITLGAEA